MRRRIARNQEETWNTMDRQSRFPIIDAHCHVFGQSLLVTGDNLHPWSDPHHVTFVKAGSDGEEKRTFRPVVHAEKELGFFGKAKEWGKFAAEQAGEHVPSEMQQKAAGEAKGVVGSAGERFRDDVQTRAGAGDVSELAEDPTSPAKAATKGLGSEARESARSMAEKAVAGMKEVPEDPEQKIEEVAESINDVREASKEVAEASMHKLYARAVVEIPEKDWPPKLKTKQVGDRMCYVVKLTKEATIHSEGAGEGHTRHEFLGGLLADAHEKTQMVGHILGNDGENAHEVIQDIPSDGGKAAVALLLDLGFTPFSFHMFQHSAVISAIGKALTKGLGRGVALPTTFTDPTGLYPEDKEFLFLDYTGYQPALERMARVNAKHAYKLWCMVAFDPRRALYERTNPPERKKAMELVKWAINDLGFVGVKIYTRCGWMPYENECIHGQVGAKLDKELDQLYKYLIEHDLPVLNHVSPGGFPPPDMHAYPKAYEGEDLYHQSPVLPKWGRIGFGPLPIGVKQILQESIEELEGLKDAGDKLPSPEGLWEQAKSLGSDMLENTARFAKKAKDNLPGHAFQRLREAQKRMRQHGQLEQMADYADPRNWQDPRKFQQMLEYFDNDEEKLREISSQIDLPEFFDLASGVDDADFEKMMDIADPQRDTAEAVNQRAGEVREAAGEARDAVTPILNTFAKIIAHLACYEAGRFCHYVQHTVSPYMWDPVLKKHPKLRLCMAHAGSSNAIMAYYMHVLKEDDREKMREALEKEGVLEAVDDELHAHPMVAPGEQFRKTYFQECARGYAKFAMAKWLGSVEQAIDPSAGVRSIIEKLLKKIVEVFFAKIAKKVTEQDLLDAVDEQIPGVIERDAWQQWLEDWESEFEEGWFKKLIDQLESYENLYCDISGSSPLPKAMLERLAEDAFPPEEEKRHGKRPDLEILADRLMIGTDWYMTTMHGNSAAHSWSHIRDVIDEEHPLWEPWSNLNAVRWINLGPRMSAMERFYKRRGMTEDAKPDWWDGLRAHYGLEDEEIDEQPTEAHKQEEDEKEYDYYTIKKGDWLSTIAPQYGMTWEELWEYDGGTGTKNKHRIESRDPDLILPEETIVVPRKS